MADQMPILNRQQLAQFLPSHEAIKAFESLFKYVSQTAPEAADDITVLVNSFQSQNSRLSQFQNQIQELEQLIQRANANNRDILNRLNNLETIVGV
jgi:chromosome segregation ATPase